MLVVYIGGWFGRGLVWGCPHIEICMANGLDAGIITLDFLREGAFLYTTLINLYTPTPTCPALLLHQLQQPLKINTLRPLNRQPQRTIPNQLRQWPQPPTDAKRCRIIKCLMEPIMMEQHPRRRIDIRIGVLGLPMLLEHLGRDFGIPLYELEDGVAGDFGSGGGEVHEGFEARVWFAEDGVAVAGDDLAGFERAPEVVFDGGVGEGGADVGLHF